MKNLIPGDSEIVTERATTKKITAKKTSISISKRSRNHESVKEKVTFILASGAVSSAVKKHTVVEEEVAEVKMSEAVESSSGMLVKVEKFRGAVESKEGLYGHDYSTNSAAERLGENVSLSEIKRALDFDNVDADVSICKV